ncbi:SH3 domain-containing protein [Tabrizicola sp.]|uniref:SH3 domain-containing protein n=1 Tax=Tabrizicola sp. TaxID=2005166 RepID=UPI0035AF3488
MLRLTLLLCLGMFVALMTLGQDRGQLRPGLALAQSEGRLDEVWAAAEAKARPAPVPVAKPAPALAALAPEPAAPTPVAPPAPAIKPAVEVEPGREVVAAVEEPIFSLASFGNEPVPGEAGVPLPEAAAPEAAAPETMALSGDDSIRYVTASSVNVRATPSTDAEILGKLANGEAALMVQDVDGEWARIIIQGDGLEGYVALRYLSPEAP